MYITNHVNRVVYTDVSVYYGHEFLAVGAAFPCSSILLLFLKFEYIKPSMQITVEEVTACSTMNSFKLTTACDIIRIRASVKKY